MIYCITDRHKNNKPDKTAFMVVAVMMVMMMRMIMMMTKMVNDNQNCMSSDNNLYAAHSLH